MLAQRQRKTLWKYEYHGGVVVVGMSRSKIISVLDSKTSISNSVKSLIIEYIVIANKSTKKEIEDKIIA